MVDVCGVVCVSETVRGQCYSHLMHKLLLHVQFLILCHPPLLLVFHLLVCL